jgi:hypothetical protein
MTSPKNLVLDRRADGTIAPRQDAAINTLQRQRSEARRKFLDTLNGMGGELRLARIAEIAEGKAQPQIDKDGTEYMVAPTIREQLDANVTLLHMQHGKPTASVDIAIGPNLAVRWDPEKFEKPEDLERYLELAKLAESVDGESD